MATEPNQLLQRDGESKLQWHKRLVYGKLEDKTLSDYDYTELAKYVYGKDYSTDVARRCMYGSKMTLDLLNDELINNVSDNKILDEITMQKIELQKEKQKFQDQRREFNKIVASSGRSEHLLDVFSEASDKLDKTVGKLFDSSTYNISHSDNDAVIVFGDWHYGMVTNNVFNKYNTDICKQRITKVVNDVINRIQLHECENAHVVVLGDMIHGCIHTSARVASEELVCDQMMQVSEILAQAIAYIAKHVSHTYVYTTYGNHARSVQDKNDSIHRDNMERILGWWLKTRFDGCDDITISCDSEYEFLLFKVRDHWFCGAHGDLDNVKDSPRLLSSLFQKQYGINLEYILLGDKHHRESYDEVGVTSLLCGSLCGTDDYANDKRLYSNPSQILLIVNKDCGVDAEYRIKC